LLGRFTLAALAGLLLTIVLAVVVLVRMTLVGGIVLRIVAWRRGEARGLVLGLALLRWEALILALGSWSLLAEWIVWLLRKAGVFLSSRLSIAAVLAV
jgi:hypothetical protein